MGDISYRPLIEDMTWSFSRVGCFESCHYKWFMNYIRGLKEEDTFYASYGSLIHKIIQLYYSGKLKQEDMSVYFLTHFQTDVKGERPQTDTVLKYIDAGLEYCKTFQHFPFDPIAIEKRIEFEINGIPFVGFIDFLGEKDGELYIIDHKSRDLKPRSNRKKPTLNDIEIDNMLRQLYVYSESVFQEYGKYPKELCFNCFKNRQFIREPFNAEAFEEAKQWATYMVHIIEKEEDFDPDIELFKCRWLCGLNEKCMYYLNVQEERGRGRIYER